MAHTLTLTPDPRFNANYELQSGLARGLNVFAGTIAVTYSGAGGITWTVPMNSPIFVQISPATSYYFTYNLTTNMIQAYYISTTGPAEEVPSDTDFTTNSMADRIRFIAFGF